MPETRGIPEPEQTFAERTLPVVREIIAGDRRGAVRRIVLNLIAITSIFISAGLAGGGLALVFAVIAVVALLLLALTDQLA